MYSSWYKPEHGDCGRMCKVTDKHCDVTIDDTHIYQHTYTHTHTRTHTVTSDLIVSGIFVALLILLQIYKNRIFGNMQK